eukprot:jgi/Botrbrau1/5303/Bobra.0391s0020.2
MRLHATHYSFSSKATLCRLARESYQSGLGISMFCYTSGRMSHCIAPRTWTKTPRGTKRCMHFRPFSASLQLQTSRSPELHHLHVDPGDVHVWWLYPEDVEDPALKAEYLNILTEREREYVKSVSQPAVARERLLARVLERTTLARYCGGPVHPCELKFERGPFGKPYLVWPCSQPLQFSLTHTGSLLGCAVTCRVAVGLDCEASSRHTRGDPMRLAYRYFHPHEIAAIESISNPVERAECFLRVWTLKEAYVKAAGRGIAQPPGFRGFAVTLSPFDSCDLADARTVAGSSMAHGRECVPSGQSASNSNAQVPLRIDFQPHFQEQDQWHLELFDIGGQHTAALCVQVEPEGSALSHQMSRSDSLNSSSTAYLPEEDEVSTRIEDSRNAGIDLHQHGECSSSFPDLDMNCMVRSPDRILGGSQELLIPRMFRTVPLVHDEELKGVLRPRLLAYS